MGGVVFSAIITFLTFVCIWPLTLILLVLVWAPSRAYDQRRLRLKLIAIVLGRIQHLQSGGLEDASARSTRQTRRLNEVFDHLLFGAETISPTWMQLTGTLPAQALSTGTACRGTEMAYMMTRLHDCRGTSTPSKPSSCWQSSPPPGCPWKEHE
jgi:hypothetical protein